MRETSLEPALGGSGKFRGSDIGWELTARIMKKKELLECVMEIKLLMPLLSS